MKHNKTVTKIAALLCLLLLALTLASCTPETDIGNNTELSRQFMDHVMADDYDSAYGMVKATVTDADFRPYWQTMQTAVNGAATYELRQIGWNVNRSNGVTTRTTAYQVYLDNDRTILLRTVTRDGIAGIAGIHFSDITDFIRTTDTYVPVMNIVLQCVSVLCLAFTVWMIVDCLRRKLKYKIVWILLIFFGIVFTVTTGKTSGFNFNIGLFFTFSSMVADPALIAVVTKVYLPLGAILYLCLRKKFYVTPETPAPEAASPEDSFAPIAPAEETTANESATEYEPISSEMTEQPNESAIREESTDESGPVV